MIPEGSHNFGVLSSYFTLGRKPIKDLQSDQSKLFSNSLLLLQKLLPPEIITKLTSCVTDNSKQEAKLFKIKNLEWLPYKFKVTDWPEDKQKRPIIDMEIHPYLDFKIIGDTKFSFKTKTG